MYVLLKPAVGSGSGSSWIRILLTPLDPDPDPYIVNLLDPDQDPYRYIEYTDPQHWLLRYVYFPKSGRYQRNNDFVPSHANWSQK